MTVSKYLPNCQCGLDVVQAGKSLCRSCLQAEQEFRGEYAEEILARLREQFGRGWFTARLSGVRRATLLILARMGYLDESKERGRSSSSNFRIKD